MSVKNVTVVDLALIELLSGETAAPPEVLNKLLARGLLAMSAGKASLTPKGRLRAESLKPAEHDLRLLFAGAAAGTGPSLHTDAASTLHLDGRLAHVRK
jgi:hypothetical protein